MKLGFQTTLCANIWPNYPAAIKVFYMKTSSWKSRACFVQRLLLAPEGYGEIIGGSMREEDYDALC